MKGKELREALRSGRRVYGTLVVADSPMWPPAVGQMPEVDFVFIDTEHQAIDRSRLSWMCRAYDAMGLAPVVRIPAADATQAAIAMDAGARGLIAPYVEEVSQVEAVAGAVKYRPVKGAQLRSWLEAGGAPADGIGDYIRRRNEASLLVINVESIRAMDNLDALLAVPELDAVLIGPHDLSCSLGIPEEYTNPRFTAAVELILDRARSRGLGAGIHYVFQETCGIEQEIAWARRGANLIVHSSDLMAFRRAIRADLERLRRELGDL